MSEATAPFEKATEELRVVTGLISETTNHSSGSGWIHQVVKRVQRKWLIQDGDPFQTVSENGCYATPHGCVDIPYHRRSDDGKEIWYTSVKVRSEWRDLPMVSEEVAS